jgi:hypothetical protein
MRFMGGFMVQGFGSVFEVWFGLSTLNRTLNSEPNLMNQ